MLDCDVESCWPRAHLAMCSPSESSSRVVSAAGTVVSLIAHDRAGFGGGLLTTGLIVGSCAWFAAPSRALRQAFWIAGIAGFGSAIGVHVAVGYTAWAHLGPAVAGAALFILGMVLTGGNETRPRTPRG